VPVGDEGDDGVALLGHPQVEGGGLLGGGLVELQALVVGVDGASAVVWFVPVVAGLIWSPSAPDSCVKNLT
jgi:hypothetical protein